MREALDTIAALLTDRSLNAESLPWAAVRYERTQAIRAKLAGRYAATTANKMLAALRGVIRECWRLQQMTGEDLHRRRGPSVRQGYTAAARARAECGRSSLPVRRTPPQPGDGMRRYWQCSMAQASGAQKQLRRTWPTTTSQPAR